MLGKLTKLHILLGYMLCFGLGGGTFRRFKLDFTEMRCYNLSSIMATYSCRLLRLAPNSYALQVCTEFTQDIRDEYEIRLIFSMLLANGKMLRLLDVKLDGCKSLQSLMDTAVLRLLITEYRRTSNFPAYCPFKAHTLYKIENFSLTTATFPAYVPDANFTFSLEMQHRSIAIAQQMIWGSISSQRYAELPRTIAASTLLPRAL